MAAELDPQRLRPKRLGAFVVALLASIRRFERVLDDVDHRAGVTSDTSRNFAPFTAMRRSEAIG